MDTRIRNVMSTMGTLLVVVFVLAMFVEVPVATALLRKLGLRSDPPKFEEGPPGTGGTGGPERYACAPVAPCYEKLEAFGNISGRLMIHIGADGKADMAGYDMGEASDLVKRCLTDAGRAVAIPSYKGKPGILVCEYGGTFMRGSQMMSWGTGFVEDQGDAKASAESPK